MQRYGKRDATIVFADDVRNEGAGIEEGRVYKGIDEREEGVNGGRMKGSNNDRSHVTSVTDVVVSS